MKRVRLFAILFIALLAFSACRPHNVLSSGKMEDVLVAIHRVDGIAIVAGYNQIQSTDRDMFYAAALKDMGVTQQQFDSSLVWYTNHPQRFNKIYPRVIKKLESEHELYVSASQRANLLKIQRKSHFNTFTYEAVVFSPIIGYPVYFVNHKWQKEFFPPKNTEKFAGFKNYY